MSVNKSRENEPRINEEIRVPSIRLIGANGDMLGVVPVAQGLVLAEEAGLDLVEISPNAEPPVCKVMDYGKFKYEAQKKANEARKKQKIIEIKEIKMRPNIDTHDYEIKVRAVKKFIADGDKVKLTLRFRGREMSHQEIGMKLLQQVKVEMGESVRVESEPRLEGRQMVMVLAPAAHA